MCGTWLLKRLPPRLEEKMLAANWRALNESHHIMCHYLAKEALRDRRKGLLRFGRIWSTVKSHRRSKLHPHLPGPHLDLIVLSSIASRNEPTIALCLGVFASNHVVPLSTLAPNTIAAPICPTRSSLGGVFPSGGKTLGDEAPSRPKE